MTKKIKEKYLEIILKQNLGQQAYIIITKISQNCFVNEEL